jgi:sulfonate transport system substrate-binding protein
MIARTTGSITATTATVLAAAVMLSGCAAGEGAAAKAAPAARGDNGTSKGWSSNELNIDFATYNPLSLVIKDQGWLEAKLGNGVKVNWVKSAGSNKANEALRAGAIDVGSTAGSAALLARANGSPITAIDVFSQPEWAALVVPAGSPITNVSQLAGKSVAVTKGTDPYFFLLQALKEAGVPVDKVEVQNLQHADGKAALEGGSVDAWSGLDPLIAASEATAGSKLLYRNIGFNTYGLLDATDTFLKKSPDLAQLVVDAYEKARAWAKKYPEKTVAILAKEAGIDPAVARKVIVDRTNLAVGPAPGEAQRKVLRVVGPFFVQSGDVASQDLIDDALTKLLDPSYVKAADPSALGGS